MQNDIKKVVVTEEQIKNICQKMGTQISKDFQNEIPLFIGLLKGCQPFMSDLLKFVSIYSQIDYMDVSSYEGTSSTGQIKINKDITCDVQNRSIIIIDDIVDTGRTIKAVSDILLNRGAKTITVATLLDKPEGRLVPVDVKYSGTSIPNEFVIGYGLDYNELYRNLPYIGVLKEEVYTKKKKGGFYE